LSIFNEEKEKMNSNNRSRFIVSAVIVLLFATMSACAKKPVASVEQADVAKVEEAVGAEADVSKTPDIAEGKGSAESLDTQIIAAVDAEPLEGRTSAGLFPLYFDFDKSIIRSDQVERVEKNAAFMKNNPGVRVRIEGNCDERGTNEYNMALGQRRALSGQQYMVNLGVAESRFDTISYGEERAINFGHDELSWSQNRRDDFVIAK
jgi:peptidoglycan-associated lipoprotein